MWWTVPLRTLALVYGIAIVILSNTASAQTPAPYPEWQNSAGVVLSKLGGPSDEWQVRLGPGIGDMPIYEGSDRYRIVPAPDVDIRYDDIAFASIGEGIGVNLLRGQTYRAGIAVAYDTGRDQHATGALNGLGNISAAPMPKLFAQVAVLPFVFTADVRRSVGGTNGLLGDLGFYIPVIDWKKFAVFIGPSVTFADDRYAEKYFGVTPAQAGPHSGFSVFNAEGGLMKTNFGISMNYSMDDYWGINTGLAYERLLDSVGESPLVRDKNQFGLSITASYKF